MKGEPDDPYLIHYMIDTVNEAVKGNVREINFQNYIAKHLKAVQIHAFTHVVRELILRVSRKLECLSMIAFTAHNFPGA